MGDAKIRGRDKFQLAVGKATYIIMRLVSSLQIDNLVEITINGYD